MKKIALATAGVVLVALVAFLIGARLFGFDPGVTAPGLWLRGEVVSETVTDWSFADTGTLPSAGLTAVETRQWFAPVLAHSVTTGRFHYKDRLYLASGYPAGIDLPEGRHWNRNVLSNPEAVRIRIDGKLYPVALTYVTDPAERNEVLRHLGVQFFSPGFFLHLWRVHSRNATASPVNQ